MVWTQVSMHRVILAWLRAERSGYVAQVLSQAGLSQTDLTRLLDNADTNNADENRTRLRLLYWARNLFVLEIPPDTAWYEVHTLKNEHIDELLVVNHQTWTSPNDNNELLRVAARKGNPMLAPLSQWQPPILWGHDRSGPFTNHRGQQSVIFIRCKRPDRFGYACICWAVFNEVPLSFSGW